jgi:hypothetical protein
MRLQRVGAVILLVILAVPAFGARDERPGVYDRIVKVIQKLVLRVIVPTGDGLIGPIPGPHP